MAKLDVKVEGLDGLIRKLDEMARKQFWFRLRFAGAELLRNEIADYPPPPKYPIRWASEKQKRWFFAAAKRGEIEVPYRRQFSSTSQRLGPSWTATQEGDEVFAGTRVSYAPYVQSKERQQPFHRDTGWITDEQAVERVAESGELAAAARELLDALFGR